MDDSSFIFIDNHAATTLMMLHGWASDWRIFKYLNFDRYNLLFYKKNTFESFPLEFAGYLDQSQKISEIILLGWSMGVFAIDRFIRQYQQYSIKDVFYISARTQYPAEQIESILNLLRQNKKAYLYQFYKSCFSKNELNSWQAFRQFFWSIYEPAFSLDILEQGLAYLSQSQINIEEYYDKIPVTMIHGEFDQIAPFQDVKPYQSQLSFHEIHQSGHQLLISRPNEILQIIISRIQSSNSFKHQ